LGVQPGVPVECTDSEFRTVPVWGLAEYQAIGDRHVGVLVPPAIAERPLTASITGAADKPA
jgi:hypothetical protein